MVRFPMYSAVIWGSFIDKMKGVSTKDSEPIELEEAGMFAQALRYNEESQELIVAVQAVHVSTSRVSGRLLNDKVEIIDDGKGMAKFRANPEIQLEMDRQGEAKVISWVPAGHQLFTYYGSSSEGDMDGRKWTHRDDQLVEFRKGAKHDEDMVRKGGKNQKDIRQYTPNAALKRHYTQEVSAEMLENMDMEMEMARKASTGNKEIIAEIRKVQEYIGSVQQRETELSRLPRDEISRVVQAAEYSGAVMDQIIGVSVAVEANRQRQGKKGHDPSVLGKSMFSEAKRGKAMERAERKRPIEMTSAGPEGVTKGKRESVEVVAKVEQKAQNVSVIKHKEANIADTPVQLRNKHGYPKCALGNMSGSHSLSVINAEWFRTADEISYDPDFRPAAWMNSAYGGKRMQFVAHLNAAIKHNEAIQKVWQEEKYCMEMSRFITEYHDIYLKMPTDMGKPKKDYCVRCTHVKKNLKEGIDTPSGHCRKMGHRCLRFCAGQAEQYRSVADFKYPAERQAWYDKGLPEEWPAACTCDMSDARGCQCSQSEEAVMAFVQNALILMPQLISPLAYQTSGQGAATEPEYIIKMLERDLKEVNKRDKSEMELFEYRVHLMRWFAVSAEDNPNRDPMGHEQDMDEAGVLCGTNWESIQKRGGGTADKHDDKWATRLQAFKGQGAMIEACCCLKEVRKREKSKKKSKVKLEKGLQQPTVLKSEIVMGTKKVKLEAR